MLTDYSATHGYRSNIVRTCSDAIIGINFQIEYDFLTEKEYESRQITSQGLAKNVVGCVAITQSLLHKDR